MLAVMAAIAPAPASATFTARPQPKWLATAGDVVGAIGKPGVTIIDARTMAEIEGKDLRNYYGAWEEWGNRDDLPFATKK
jgi:3-mercaptopyruvate sulfurtransferase SseA